MQTAQSSMTNQLLGQFFTPPFVKRIMLQWIDRQNGTIAPVGDLTPLPMEEEHPQNDDTSQTIGNNHDASWSGK